MKNLIRVAFIVGGMPRNRKSVNRREVLKTSGSALTVGLVGSLAGCAGSGGDGGSGDGGSGDSGGGSSDGGSGDGGSGDGGDGDSTGTSTSMDSGGEEMEIRLAHTQPPKSINVQAVQSEFIDRLETETDGRITFDLEAATLGGSEDNLDAAQAGAVDMVIESPIATATRYAPPYTFTGDPFVVRNMDHYKKIQQEFIFPDDGMNGEVIPQGLRMFHGYRWGNRGFTSNKPVRTPEDVQGLKLRLPQFDSWVGVWEEIGATPTPVAFDELYSALETGVAEASEGPITQFMATSLYEVQSHFSITNHLLGVHHFIMNEDFYQGLNSSDRDLLTTTIEEAADDITATIREQEQGLYDDARDEGTTIVPREDIDRAAFVDAGTPFLEELASSEWAVSLEDVQSL